MTCLLLLASSCWYIAAVEGDAKVMSYSHRVTEDDPVTDISARSVSDTSEAMRYDASLQQSLVWGQSGDAMRQQGNVGGLHHSIGRPLSQLPPTTVLIGKVPLGPEVPDHELEANGHALKGLVRRLKGLGALKAKQRAMQVRDDIRIHHLPLYYSTCSIINDAHPRSCGIHSFKKR